MSDVRSAAVLPGRALSGRTRVAGVLGWPIAHSLSPRLHGYWLNHHGIDGVYVPLPVNPEHLGMALQGLIGLGFAGANITVPHKERAAAAVTELSPEAARIGSINTVVVTGDGRLHGHSTDGFGFIENLRANHRGWRADDGAAVVIGAGGAARAIVAALLDAGATQIRLVNRTLDHAETVAAKLSGPIAPVPWAERSTALADATLLVNTTTLGMAGQPALPLDLQALPPAAVVVDIVYAPRLTPLLKAAAARGNPVVDGLGMLLHQARPGFAAWFGIEPAVTPELYAFVAAGLPQP